MEILEAVFALAGAILESGEACLCFVQLLTVVLDAGTFFTGVSAVRETRKRRDEGLDHGPNTKLIAFWVLVPFALIATVLAEATITTALRQRP